jgi:uncharacterized membrane protein HdeD (DUF308 family)
MATERTTLLGSILNLENEELKSALAANSSWIICFGLVDLIVGFMALVSPVAATMASYSLVTALFYVAGIFHCIGGCFSEPGYKVPIIASGLWQILVASILKWYPLTVLTVVTIFIAIFFMCEGTFRTSIACSNKDMPGYCATYFSGLSSILLSVIIIATMPLSAIETIGILLGCNLTALGFSRLMIGCTGRSLAKELENGGGFIGSAGNMA